MELLPSELLQCVAGHVGAHGQKLLAVLSKELHARMLSSCTSLHVVQQPDDPLERIVHRLRTAGAGALPSLFRLHMTLPHHGREDETLQPMQELARATPRLRHLTLERQRQYNWTACTPPKPEAVPRSMNMDALGCMETVAGMELCGLDYGEDMCRRALSCMKNVQALTLSCMPVDHPIIGKLSALPQLRYLRLEWMMPSHSGATVDPRNMFSCLSAIAGLRVLRLGSTPVAKEEDVPMLSRLQQLEELELSVHDEGGVANSAFASIGSLENLRSLKVAVELVSGTYAIDISPLSCCTNLHNLSLWTVDEPCPEVIGVSSLHQVLGACPLEYLYHDGPDGMLYELAPPSLLTPPICASLGTLVFRELDKRGMEAIPDAGTLRAWFPSLRLLRVQIIEIDPSCDPGDMERLVHVLNVFGDGDRGWDDELHTLYFGGDVSLEHAAAILNPFRGTAYANSINTPMCVLGYLNRDMDSAFTALVRSVFPNGDIMAC